MPAIYIGLGSNIDAEQNLSAAAKLLRSRYPSIRFSSVYKSKAMEVTDQSDFLNAVAVTETNEPPQTILRTLQNMEAKLKKNPPMRYGPRTIDLDLLLYENQVIHTAALTIPHEKMHLRRFVLEPLCELIDPTTLHPVLQESWKELLEKTKSQRCEKITLELPSP